MKTALGVVCSLCLLSGGALPHVSAQAPADAAAAIQAAHARIDAAYQRSSLSPFTAVGVRYFEAGQSARIGADGNTVQFDPSAGVAASIEMTWDGKGFTLTPVTGPAPIVYDKAGPDDVDMRTPRPIAGPIRLKDNDAVALGRFFVESYGKQGNVRLYDPAAPARKAFRGLKWFPPVPSLQVKASYERLAAPTPLVIMTSRGLQREYYRVGQLAFSVGGTALRLTALRLTALSPSATPNPGDELFIPFRDTTTGVDTYSVGRYLTLKFEGADAAYVLDFNLATNPLCNYSPHYNCPIPPRENLLPVAIRAGEMTFPTAH